MFSAAQGAGATPRCGSHAGTEPVVEVGFPRVLPAAASRGVTSPCTLFRPSCRLSTWRLEQGCLDCEESNDVFVIPQKARWHRCGE